jgi:hypothetical protein
VKALLEGITFEWEVKHSGSMTGFHAMKVCELVSI